MKKHYKFLGFEFSKVDDVVTLSFLNRNIYCKIGKSFCLFGYFRFHRDLTKQEC